MYQIRSIVSAAAVLSVGFAAFALGCSDASSTRPDLIEATDTASALWWRSHSRLVTRVSVKLDSSTLAPSHVTGAKAIALNYFGEPVSGVTPTWSSSDTAVATVSSSGNVTGEKAGSVDIRAVVNGVAGGAPLVVSLPNSAPAMRLVVSTPAAGAVSGLNLATQPIVEVRDSLNGLVSASSAVVTATVSSGSATLAGTTTVTAVSGVAKFTNLRLSGSGTVALAFTSPGLSSPTPTSVTVAQMPASLAIQTQPGGATSGSQLTMQPVVRILDNAGLLVADATIPVTAKITSGTGTLGGTTTVNAVGGIATFTNLRIDGSSNSVLTFSTASPALQVASLAFSVAVAPAAQLAITMQPAGATSGASFTTQPIVEVRDASNNVVTTSSAGITAAIASGTGTLSGTTTVNAINGKASFSNLAITGTGDFTLRFSSTGLTQATSNTLSVVAAANPATQLSIATQPASTTQSGAALTPQPAIQLRDASNNPVSQAGVVVTASVASGTATLGGTTTATTNGSGLATFSNLTLTGTGSETLRFSAIGLTAVTSSTISLTTTTTTALTTANIVNNASFENTWQGFTNWSAGAPTGVSLDNTRGYDGSWSVQRSWVPNPGGDVGAQLAYNFGTADHIWVRFYFRLTAPITTIMKFMRFYTPGFGQPLGGLFLGQGNDIFTFGTDAENSAISTSIGLTQAQVIDGNWHSLEADYWRNGDPSGWPSVAFWFDGQPLSLPDGTPVRYSCAQSNPPSTCSRAYWSGGRLYTGARATSASMTVMEWIATLNGGNTTTGQVNLDRISISTVGRIGQ